MNKQRPAATAEVFETNRRHDSRVPCLRGDQHVYGNGNLRPVRASMQPENERARSRGARTTRAGVLPRSEGGSARISAQVAGRSRDSPQAEKFFRQDPAVIPRRPGLERARPFQNRSEHAPSLHVKDSFQRVIRQFRGSDIRETLCPEIVRRTRRGTFPEDRDATKCCLRRASQASPPSRAS